MHTIDPGENTPADDVDGGSTASPPTDIYISMFNPDPQVITGAITPDFLGMNDQLAVNPGRRVAVHARIGGTSTTVTVEVPGTQPYSGAARDDLSAASVSNADRVFYMPDLVNDPDSEVAVVTFSQTAAVTAVIVQVP